MPPKPCQLNKECLESYACSAPMAVMEGAIYSPYVELSFGAAATITGQDPERLILTVGNQSQPNANLAAITSFSYGFQNGGGTGQGAEIEVIDNGGAMYRSIIRALNKSAVTKKQEVSFTEFDFGWIVTDTSGNSMPKLITAKRISGKIIRSIFLEAETNFDGGNVKIKIKLAPPSNEDTSVPQTGSIGTSDQPVDLKYAITQLLTRPEVGYSGVDFLAAGYYDADKKYVPSTSELNFPANIGGAKGPKASWPLEQQSALNVVRNWLATITTENGRGILILYNNENNKIIIQEDPTDTNGKCCAGHIATYVVNGGGCSPVLEFNPTISWPKGLIPGNGGTGGGASGGGGQNINPIIDIQKTGAQTNPVLQQHEWQFRPPEEHVEAAVIGYSTNTKSEQSSGAAPSGGKPAWSADLKIMGDPFYSNPILFVGTKFVSIVFINPYFFGDAASGTWLQTSTCNSMLSNKKYQVTGVSHNIGNGTYTTTLKLMLPVPNIDKPYTDSAGGNGCGSNDQNFVDASGKSTT